MAQIIFKARHQARKCFGPGGWLNDQELSDEGDLPIFSHRRKNTAPGWLK
jgi:hypothetical protein